jgi:hypothetical protein
MKLWRSPAGSYFDSARMPSTQTAPVSRRGRSSAQIAMFAVAGLLLVGFGWLIPSQFKSVPISVLAEAGKGTPGLASAVRNELDAGRPGTAALMADAAAAVRLPGADQLIERVSAFARENPDLALWGEASPHLDRALPPGAGRQLEPSAGIVRHLLPAPSRREVAAYLGGSRNATVRAVLATRELKTWRQFLPVYSAGGAPLESTILLAALLAQSDQLGDGASRELRALAEEAVRTGEAVALELVYLDLLSLGRRYTWGQLVALTRGAESLETLAKLRHLLQVAPDQAAAVSAAVVLSRQPDQVTDYVIEYGADGAAAIAYALHHGSGSLKLLLRQRLPVDGALDLPPVPNGSGVARAAVDPLVRLAFRQPALAVGAKFAAYLLGGLLLFLAAERITALRRLELSPVFTYAARAVGACTVCLLLVVINEPYLALGSQPAGYELRLVIPVLGATSIDAMNQTTHAMPIDAATLLSILFFFLLQSLVYLICLLKIREIEAKKVPGLLKLRLMENEENLFDSGLYVGIAGTCAALVLQVLGVVQANLLAAYSSNLFGILCVAFIKIRHVRPYKQRLIIEASEIPVVQPQPVVPPQPAAQPQPTRAG